jgi:hypothetical protein
MNVLARFGWMMLLAMLIATIALGWSVGVWAATQYTFLATDCPFLATLAGIAAMVAPPLLVVAAATAKGADHA